MQTSFKPKNFLLVASLFISSFVFAQSDWKNWVGSGINLAFSKKLEIGLSHLRSYDVSNSFQNNFNQSGINLEYDLSKQFSVKTGFSITQLPADGVTSNKYFSRLNYKMPVGKIINWANSLQGEIHTAKAKGSSYRIIYISRIALKHRLNFLKLSPSISYWLFYNIGGNAIQYFDESGSPLVKDTPDGLHRGRLILNLNSKLSKNLSLSLYYINQHEFNLSGNNINVVNPRTGKIARPFKNYQVAGVSLSFSFQLYKQHRNK